MGDNAEKDVTGVDDIRRHQWKKLCVGGCLLGELVIDGMHCRERWQGCRWHDAETAGKGRCQDPLLGEPSWGQKVD